MNIQINKDYRLAGYKYGWRIEKRGEKGWLEDRPAYPASLAAALESVAERIFKDGGDCTIDQLPQRLRQASTEVRKALASARRAA